jgi:hypothetical protein
VTTISVSSSWVLAIFHIEKSEPMVLLDERCDLGED